ncbi:phage tail protein I [Sphingobium sp. AS12]|uniref:phage tail protein I n=1 Tax=Sphingobium sp. AS12 TaxID=2849495 RepID=UPI001C31E4AE|nr:phage tail protein I [Sphingobium sp. AS12]MBV2149281.1 phage tail protein I [Sphingobium sp. AS12]
MTRPTILPPGSTALEKALEQIAAARTDMPVQIRTYRQPANLSVSILPWLAWELSLDNWSSDWPETIKRARVRQAIPIARRKGTAASVRDVVASFGGSVAIREWWQTEPKGEPHTFTLSLNLNQNGVPSSAAFVDQVIAEVIRAKPVRSHFTFTQGLTARADVGVIAAARPVAYARLNALQVNEPPPMPPEGYQLLMGADGSYLRGVGGVYIYGAAK